MTKKLSTIWLTLIAAFMILGLAVPNQNASARGFSGGHTSFHSTYHATPTRSYHMPNSYHVNRYPSSQYNTRRHSGIASEFGHSVVRGTGWSIGSHMGDSIWHRAFGFGSDRYVDNYGQVQYARPGHSGWVMIVIILAIVAIVIAIRRTNHRNDHQY